MEENDEILIVKYITGQATEDEVIAAKYLISSNKHYEEFYILKYEGWQKSLLYNTDIIDTNKAYAAFLANTAKPPVIKPLIPWSRLAVAASLIIVLASGLYFYKQSAPSQVPQYISANEIKVPKGSTRKAVLKDGTVVWINAGSILKFEEGFGKSSRTVYLDGEAYFDIAENQLPFIVRTKNHTIRDIGTIFNIKAYSDDQDFETAVIEGEVSVENTKSDQSENKFVSVKKQQVLKLSYPAQTAVQGISAEPELNNAKILRVSSSQLEHYTGWTEDLLVFEGETFQEISRIMERKYDVEIIMNDATLRNYEYTGSFKRVDEVDKALQILKETTPINYSKNGRIITIWEVKP